MKRVVPTSTAIALILLTHCACGPVAAWAPDGIASGIVFREVRGRDLIDREEALIPLVRIEVDKGLSDTLDLRGWFDFVNGRVELDSGIIEQAVRGDMQAGGVGLRYHPFSKYLNFDVGAELFRADYSVITKPSLFSARNSDKALGWGLSAGLSTAIPLTESIELTASGGYIVSDNDTDDIHMSFDSFYFMVGLRVALKW